ncbi:MAG: thiamine-phosphate kinase [Bacteroidota bacterium]
MTERTELSSLGEFGLIDRLTKAIGCTQTSTIKGIGDDAAVIKYENKVTLVSTDLLTEGIHFDLSYIPLKHLGYKAAIVNFSDIYAMNGTPSQLLVSIAISNRFSLEAIEELYEGLKLACKKYGVDLVGGDTSSSAGGMFMSLTALGEAEQDKVVYRNTAQVGDLICVSGDLGAAFAGLLILEREKEVFLANPNAQPDIENNDYVLQRQLRPEARKDIIAKLEELQIKPTSMIDISDGLASEVMHLCYDSEKGCNVYENKIPIDFTTVKTAEDFNMEPLICALNGGEDYELLFTIDLKDYEKIIQLSEISIIGHITEAAEGMNLITNANQAIEITAQGWDAFKRR